MDQDDYENHLVDKAKDLLQTSEELKNKERRTRKTAEDRLEPDDADDARKRMERKRKEAKFLARNRNDMDNEEMEAFLRGDSDFHDTMQEADNPDFSDWENRVLITNPDTAPETLADELDRSVEAVKFQMDLLGLDGEGYS